MTGVNVDPAVFSAALQAVTYSFTPQASRFPATTPPRQVLFTVNDNGPNNNIGTALETITVSPLNHAPTLQVENIPASATATLTGSTVGSIAVNYGGAGYSSSSPPAVTLTGGGVTPATATAVVTNGVVTAINITNSGAGYTSAPTITIAPSLVTASNPVTVLENGGPQTLFLTGISDGDANTQTPLTFSFSVTNSSNVTNPAVKLISNVAITYDGDSSINSTSFLTFTLAPNDSGTATINLTLMDSGPSGNGNVNSITVPITVTVLPVNPVPTLNAIPQPPHAHREWHRVGHRGDADQPVGHHRRRRRQRADLDRHSHQQQLGLDPQSRLGDGDAQRRRGGRDRGHERRLRLRVPAGGHADRRRLHHPRDGHRACSAPAPTRVWSPAINFNRRLGLHLGADGHNRPADGHRGRRGDDQRRRG